MESKLMNQKKVRANVFLLLTAFIWGAAFVAQQVGMEHIGPFTFNGARMLVSGVVLTPIVLLLRKKHSKASEDARLVPEKNNKTLFLGGFCCGFFLFAASSFQQVGLLYTTAGKAGFITALYILIVPLLGVFMKKKLSKTIWFCVVLACIGVYLLCMVENFTMNQGDFIMLFSALSYALHIITVDYFSPKTDGVAMSLIQFFVAAFFCFIPMFAFEAPKITNILISWIPLLYVGVLSGAVGYTLQIIAQRDTTPTIAALLLSLESVFAVLMGAALLNERMSYQEITGCILMFAAIIIAQLPERSGRDKIIKKGEPQ